MVKCITLLSSLHIPDLPSWVTVLLTAVIAAATIAYVRLTKRLWEETKKSADAATTSAEATRKSAEAAVEAALAAKKSTEIAAALHRPFVGLSSVIHKSGWGTDSWEIVFVLKNYGSLPALNVGMMIEFFADTTRVAQVTEPTAVQIFPSVELESNLRLGFGQHRIPIQQGQQRLLVSVRIPYKTEDGRNFEYSAQVSYAANQPAAPYLPGRFVIDRSETN
jgi:hypothetical protein